MTVVRPDQPTAPLRPAENSLRIVPIFANLMPTEVVETRRGRRARGLTVTGLILLVAAIAGVYALAWMQTSGAREDLDARQAQATELLRQQNKYADVVRIQDESKRVEQQLSTLLAKDLGWSGMLAALRDTVPSGVAVDNVSASLIAEEQGGGTAKGNAAPSQDPKAKPVGTVVISGSGSSKPAIAAYADALSNVDGIIDPYINSVTQEKKDKYLFNLRLTFTDQLLGGRFTKSDSKAGGK